RARYPADRHQRPAEGRLVSAPVILALMSFCFLFFGYLGVPVPFSLMAGVFIGAILSDVSLAAIIQKIFDGVDSEALLAIPFFLLVGELMSSANVVVRIANLSVSLVGHIMGGLSQVVVGFGPMIYCYFFGSSGLRKPRAPLRQMVFAAGDAALLLLIAVILLEGILTGWFTPTEAGVVAVAWIVLVVIPALIRGHFRKI